MPVLKPRNNCCVIQKRTVDKRGSMYMPQQSIEGMEFVVVAVGPKVKDLVQGDKVLCTGVKGEDYAYLPGSNDLFIIKQENILLRFGEDGEEPRELQP